MTSRVHQGDGLSRFFARVASTGGSEIINRLTQMLSLSLVGWLLGIDGLAVVGLAWSLTTVALAIIQGGPDLIGYVQLAAHPHDRTIIVRINGLKLIFGAIAAPLLMAALLLLGHDDASAMRQLAAQYGAMMLAALSHVWVLRCLGRSRDQAMTRLIQAALTIGVLWGGLWLLPSPLIYPLADGLGGLCALLYARHRLGPTPDLAEPARPSLAQARSALKLGTSCLLATLMWQTPVILAARWGQPQDISYLSGVIRLLSGANGLIQICLLALVPVLVGLRGQDVKRAATATAALCVHAGLACSLICLACLACGDWFIPLLLGPDMQGAAHLFKSLSPVLIPLAVSAPAVYMLVALQHETAVTLVQGAGTLLMLLGCAIWPPDIPAIWMALILYPVGAVMTLAYAVLAERRGLLAWPCLAQLHPLCLAHLATGATAARDPYRPSGGGSMP